jgi:eukaryotic-like serine/threonine-protein kinase
MGSASATSDLDAFEAASSLGRGSLLGGYELLMPVAAGGMGQVWAARVRDSEALEIVAVKTILPVLMSDAEVQKMFLDEARIASLVDDPRVCRIRELGEEGHVLFMVLEWVEGDSLRATLRGPEGNGIAPASPRIVAGIVREVCRGLHVAHELVDEDGTPLGTVHRDVSPQNILLSVAGEVKVTDFGLVKALGRLQITRASRPKGKVGFMAPEQLMGENVDRRADIFSAGCVMYEAATGKHPFPGDGEPQVIAKMLLGELPAPREIDPDLPEELEQIILKALAQSPDARFSTAEELGAALDLFLEYTGGPVSAREIADFVRGRRGEAIDERQRAIVRASERAEREALGLEEPPALPRRVSRHSGIAPLDTPSAVHLSPLPRREPAPRGARLAVAGVAVATALALLALGSRAPSQPGESSATVDAPGLAAQPGASSATVAPSTAPVIVATPAREPTPAPSTTAGLTLAPRLPTVTAPHATTSASAPPPEASATAAPSASAAPAASIPSLPNPYAE